MRLAIMISLGLAVWTIQARADEALKKVEAWTHVGYILSEEQAQAHKLLLIDSIPGIVRVEGFWTPTDQDVAVADRVFRDYIMTGLKDPEVLIPHLYKDADSSEPGSPDFEKQELQLIFDHYDEYQRQYVGIVIRRQRVVICNYSHGPNFDATRGYIYMQKFFEPGGTVQFLQCHFDPINKTCSKISIVGSWQSDK